jgi:hypothetical protein
MTISGIGPASNDWLSDYWIQGMAESFRVERSVHLDVAIVFIIGRRIMLAGTDSVPPSVPRLAELLGCSPGIIRSALRRLNGERTIDWSTGLCRLDAGLLEHIKKQIGPELSPRANMLGCLRLVLSSRRELEAFEAQYPHLTEEQAQAGIDLIGKAIRDPDVSREGISALLDMILMNPADQAAN